MPVNLGLLAFVLAAECLVPPVAGSIVEPFQAPACEYCPGRRGVELASRPGGPVVAAAGGDVTYAGEVAGTTYVVVRHADGVRATYGRLVDIAPGLDEGDRVTAGQLVGRSGARLWFGLRAPDATSSPIDPTSLIGRWRYRARLVPTDGRPARPAPPPRLVCRFPAPGR